MEFWATAGAEAIAGITVAIVVAALALFGTDRYAARRARSEAARERNLAAAADFYRVLGQFFAAWKLWEYHSEWGPSHKARQPATDERRSQLIANAAEAEGGYESLIVRIALEHDLEPRQEKALWCLRSALKELRSAIRGDRRLTWWRTYNKENATTINGYRDYMAFKALISEVAQILINGTIEVRSRGPADRAASLRRITGNGGDFIGDRESSELREKEVQQRTGARLHMSRNWEWVLLAEDFDPDLRLLAASIRGEKEKRSSSGA